MSARDAISAFLLTREGRLAETLAKARNPNAPDYGTLPPCAHARGRLPIPGKCECSALCPCRQRLCAGVVSDGYAAVRRQMKREGF